MFEELLTKLRIISSKLTQYSRILAINVDPGSSFRQSFGMAGKGGMTSLIRWAGSRMT